jgi:hypothetical protein
VVVILIIFIFISIELELLSIMFPLSVLSTLRTWKPTAIG